MKLSSGETITDEAKFLTRNASYAEHCSKYAQRNAQEKLDRYYQLKQQKNDESEPN